MSIQNKNKLVTISTLGKLKKAKEKFSCLTAYESTLAQRISEAGVEVILVGDSLGMVIQGHDSTLPVTMDQLIYHLDCVARGNVNSHIMADMPFMSYSTDELALENATKLMQNGAHSVKIEGGSWICKMTSTLAERGIPVCAHMGLTPQSINRIGGYFVQGRDTKKRQKLIEEAKSLESAGAAMLLLECVPNDLSKEITSLLKIPVIGIGAGPETDGQIMVIHDLLGISCLEKPPKFVKDFLKGSSSIEAALAKYVKSVKSKKFPSRSHTFF
jgi:3-methyl-2-oxobutanoate hydroxymethyltransferase